MIKEKGEKIKNLHYILYCKILIGLLKLNDIFPKNTAKP
jgi:hypothetical protein